MGKLRISVVSYLNAEPFHSGLLQQSYSGFEISEDIPSVCADKLLNKEADLGLVPVAMYPALQKKGGEIVTDYCIASDGNVGSVMLYSEVPPEQIKTIYLDKESRTSVALLKLLAEKHFKIQPEWLQETEYAKVEGPVARLLIGDRALAERRKHRIETDLGLAWKNFTGLPFVFACWVSMRPLSAIEAGELNAAFTKGLEKREEIALKNATLYPGTDLEHYLKKNIRYYLYEESRKGLELFLQFLAEPVNQSFFRSSSRP